MQELLGIRVRLAARDQKPARRHVVGYRGRTTAVFADRVFL